MTNVEFKLEKGIAAKLKGRYDGHSLFTGVLNSKSHNEAMRWKKSNPNNKSTYLGGPVRKQTRQPDGDMGTIFKDMQATTGINLLSAPLKSKKSRDIMRLLDSFFKMVQGSSLKVKRLENALQALIRNPILRGDYGGNTELTTKIKGFNRLFIDTAQVFKNITGRVKAKKVKNV